MSFALIDQMMIDEGAKNSQKGRGALLWRVRPFRSISRGYGLCLTN